MKNKTLIFLGIACLSVLSASAGTPLDKIYNSFISFYSDGNPAWKTNVTFDANVNTPPKPPFKLYRSDTFGYYSYRPKTWNELNSYEQFAVKTDPRMPHFVQQYVQNETPTAITTFPLIEQAATPTAKPDVTMTPVSENTPAVSDTLPTFSTQVEHVNKPELLGGNGVLVPAPPAPSKVYHVLTPEEKGTFGYTFTPADLTSTKPVKLMEVGNVQ